MATLIVQDVERTFLVGVEDGECLVLGRSADCDVPIEAPRASRRHLEVRARAGGHVVVDLGSTNGTLLNDAPLAGEAPLADGDRLQVGGCTILYRRPAPRAQ